MVRLTQKTVNAVALSSAAATFALLLALSPVRASDWLAYQHYTPEKTPIYHQRIAPTADRVGELQGAKQLIHARIQNSNGEILGSVTNLILDNSRNAVAYVVITSRGADCPVPWSAFDVSTSRILLNVDKSKFMEAPAFSATDLSLLSISDSKARIDSFYSSRIAAVEKKNAACIKESSKQTAAVAQIPELCLYTDVAGLSVRNSAGENIADIRNIIFDTRQGSIAYCLVGFGGFRGFAQSVAAVPWSSLTIDPQQKMAVLAADRQMLASAVIRWGNLKKLNDPGFARQIHRDFGAEPYWEVLGYVPPVNTSGKTAAPPGKVNEMKTRQEGMKHQFRSKTSLDDLNARTQREEAVLGGY